MTGDAAALLHRYDDFSGGHYGAIGARRADKNQYGGVNMVLTRDGSLAPASQSRPLVFSNMPEGRVHGIHWAWGVDGLVYFVQESAEGGTFKVRRFDPDPTVTITVEDVGDVGSVQRRPAWCDLGGNVYVSIWADATYRIDVSGPSLSAMSGGEGAVPGGRAITAYGERLFVGGVDDARYAGARGNRIVYSEAADFDNMLTLNFFDAGADLIEIAALVPMGDQLVIVFSDQQFWVYRGVPGSSTLRRAFGHHRGSGAIRNFENDQALTDPSQGRVWFFDHVTRGPASFNGAQVTRVGSFGAIEPDRTAEDRVEGSAALIGGPGEFIMDRIVLPRTEGESARGDSLDLVRVGGAFAVVEQRVLTRR